MTFKTDQESFWAGRFGVDYIQRNRGEDLLAANLSFFSKALRQARDIRSCMEFGANIGMNIRAIKLLHPGLECHAIEINAEAAKFLSDEIPSNQVQNVSILDFSPKRRWDLILIKGVLIHMNPDTLPQVYDTLFTSCERYLLIAEYYSPSPVAIPYRGYTDRLFKRDFAGEMMDRHPSLRLVDYGFSYRRDPSHPQDDITWFLLGKN